ncbi:SusC/RagA family TonB-linked outer membrane protein [Sphingobacterium psychroaquaticum]|uniref:TonB-linked outer membrane protein, SusC/RagA family n=1 Tax=Sphingobacterium psychroaquaticum TaxID=561061 RepID=A0A1X7K5F3_9SPHI|nr:SusC/RagA family TonB-linked outer membrane protein [Sphingobacterium psychroaquaticum]SMG36076.1 TonB-linked outer membrane protein, SusC/RagA family [Sphingobacterium psychroaquaticum]
MNKFLLLFLFSWLQFAQGQEWGKWNGQVLDAKTQKPVVGATIMVESSAVAENTAIQGQIQQSALGTVTDENGMFTLSLPKGVASVTISFVGYDTQKVAVNKLPKTILMQPNDATLEEVIVTGYTDIKKRKNTTSYTKIKADEIQQIGVSGIDQMLEGQVAGLQLMNLNGGPNSAPQIRIRGTVSTNGTQDPLWVIDGLPIEGTALPNSFDKDNLNNLTNLPIAGINPDDIQDITVLKDAAATSIYGARAANGVIVITTKRGKSGPSQVSVSANTFINQKPDFDRLNLMNASEKVDFELAMAGRTDLDYRTDKGAIARILSGASEWDAYRKNGFSGLSTTTQQAINSLRTQGTDWGNTLYRNSLNQQYTASVSGGNDAHRYYISAGFYDEQGATQSVDMRRYTLSFNNDFRISNTLKGGLSLMGGSTERNNPLQDVDAFANPSVYARTANPYLPIRDANGNYVYDPDIEGYSNDTYIPFNSMEERTNTRYNLNNKSLKAITFLEYQIIPSLSLRSELGMQFEEIGIEKFADKESYNTRKLRAATRYYDSASKEYKYFLPDGGMIDNSHNRTFQYNWKSFAQYRKEFGGRHEVEVMAGTELRRTNSNVVSTKGFGYDPRTLTTQSIVFPNSNFATDARFRQYAKGIGETAYASFYANAGYTLDGKYNVYGSIRYDGSNMFGVDPKYRFLPIWSLSGSWNASQEEFIKSIDVISNLRVRASYGIQGNIDRNTYPFIIGNYGNAIITPGNNEETIVVTAPANDKLRWEKTKSWNLGLDIGLWENRLNITADCYNRTSTDLIGYSMLPLENGFEQVQRNWGSVRNEGVELTISSRNIQRKGFTWSTDFNIAHNNNRMLRVLNNPQAYNMTVREGSPINSLFVLETAGLDADGLMQFKGVDGQAVSFEDFYGLYDQWADFFPGVMTGSNLTREEYRNKFSYKGSLDPKFVGGMTNRFTVSNFDFAVTAAFNIDRWMKARPFYNPATVDRGANQVQSLQDIASGSSNVYQAIGSTNSELNDRWMAYSWMLDKDPVKSYEMLDIWAKKMSYVRITSIRLGYTLPKVASAKIGASNLRVSVEARNPFVFGSSYKGYFDPESYGNIYAQPITKSFAVGLSARF